MHTEVMQITGHTQLKTFLRYLNITAETAQKVANNLDNYLGLQKKDGTLFSDKIN
jgi:hypothetical protein